MEIIKEITGTIDDFRYPEHIYFLDDNGKLIAMIKEGTTEKIEFFKPMSFYKSRRKFKKVKSL